MFYCSQASVVGADFGLYALPPDRPSGEYQCLLDRVLPSPGPFYYANLPSYVRGKAHRKNRTVPFAPVSTSLNQEVQDHPEQLQLLNTWQPGHTGEETVLDLPAYQALPRVQEARRNNQTLPLPIALYLDGVSYSSALAGRQDSVVGVWAVNLISGKRHLFGVQRIRDLCRCGCRGWCTMWGFLRVVSYLLELAVNGDTGDVRHDGTPLNEFDPFQRCVKYLAKCAILWIKGDWSEHHLTLALQSWASVHCPCSFCQIDKEGMHLYYQHCTVLGLPFIDRTPDEYDASCRHCEIELTLETPEQRRQLITDGQLTLLKGKQGKGLTVTKDFIPTNFPAGLRIGDRIEPSKELPFPLDVFSAPLPLKITLWRIHLDPFRRATDPVIHRCPLFDPALGTTPQTLAIDTLHTLYYGPIMRYCCACLWRLILNCVWPHHGDQEARRELACKRMSAELSTWQDAEQIPHENCLPEITITMLGGDHDYDERDPNHPGGA